MSPKKFTKLTENIHRHDELFTTTTQVSDQITVIAEPLPSCSMQITVRDPISTITQRSAFERKRKFSKTTKYILKSLEQSRNEHLTAAKKKIYSQLLKIRRYICRLRRRGRRPAKRQVIEVGNLTFLKHFENDKHLPSLNKYFINSQLKLYSQLRRCRSYTVEEKALFLAMFNYSPKGYKHFSEIFLLPSPKTLQKWLSNVDIHCGINDNIFHYLNLNSLKMRPADRFCILMFGEVHINKKITNRVLVFMLRGFNMPWKQALAFYFIKSTADSIANCIGEVIKTVHNKTQFKILATVSNLSSSNKAAIDSLCDNAREEYIYDIDNENIIHLFDVPHLIKSLRNHFLTKNIIFDDSKCAKFEDIVTLYEIDGKTKDAKVTKLTKDHISPKGHKKMKTLYAVQLFSRITSAALTFATNIGRYNFRETAEFVFFINKLFDSLNSCWKTEKTLANAVTLESDHTDSWAKAVDFLEKLKFVDAKNNSSVATPLCIHALIATLLNVDLLWEILKDHVFIFLFTRTLSQEPLENFLSVVKGLCGQNTKPTCFQFMSAFKTALFNDTLKNSSQSKCEDDGAEYLLALKFLLSQNSP